MPLNAVFLVFMDFDIFRNVSLVHQGFRFLFCLRSSIYQFRIYLKNQREGRILFCRSNPCTKSNIRNNRYVVVPRAYKR